MSAFDTFDFDPTSVDLDTADAAQVVCYLNQGSNEYDGRLGARVAALFVILVVSSAATFFPVLAVRVKWVRIPVYVYYLARYFGAGVIVATAFIHLLDPAYSEIGPQSCVGMTGGWADYSFCPAIVLTSATLIFLMDFGAEYYVEQKYGFTHTHVDVEGAVTRRDGHRSHQFLHSGEVDGALVAENANQVQAGQRDSGDVESKGKEEIETISINTVERSFQQQIAAFLILEFGVIFHSVIIGLNLGTAGSEFTILFPVLVFHQSFEGLGIGARLSTIPIPERLSWLPWALCSAYGLTTPIAIAIGLGLRTTYNASSPTASIVSGVLDATSAGILIYTGLVELLARDFLFNPERTRNKGHLIFMICCVLLGIALMALLGKWA